MSKYMSVSLPVEILKLVDEKIKGLPYSSRADFVKESIRRDLQRIEKFEREKP